MTLDSIPLSPISQHKDPESDPEELDPESTSALLRRHLRESAEDDDDAAEDIDLFNPFRRVAELMSKAPLLLRAAPGLGVGSYGAAPIHASSHSDDEDDVRRRDRRKSSTQKHGSSSGADGSSRSTAFKRQTSDTGSQRSHRRGSVTEELLDDIGSQARVNGGGISVGADVPSKPSGRLNAAFEDHEDGSEDVLSIPDDEDPPDNSPYAQVRASVSAVDNITLSINTPRMWVLSVLFAILGSAANLFFSLRYPSVTITPVIALLLVHPLGLLWDQLLKRRDDPEERFDHGTRVQEISEDCTSTSRLQHLRLWLAQGTWNEKEHSCVYVSSNVAFGFAFATDVIVEQTHFYNQKVSITYQLLLILSTQILGYAFAGLSRRFLVRPGGMIWPGTLMSAAMFTTLHKEGNTVANGWKITRWRFFFIVWSGSFMFYFLPGLLMPALSYFSVITWFAPKNVVVANIFGVASGLGLVPVTFDWAQIAYIGSPLLTPFWAAMNVIGGLVIVMWIIAPIAYYLNFFYSSYMPILSSSVFDNTGKIYDVSKILTSDFVFDREAYHKYSRVYLPITYILSYGLQFAALASLLTHTICWHGQDIWKQWKRSLGEMDGEAKIAYKAVPTNGHTTNGHSEGPGSPFSDIISQEDVHNRLMSKYKDAPLSWYLITFISMLAIGVFVVE